MYLGEYRIDDYVTLIATTHRFSSGAAYAPTAITYRVYEDATDVEIVADTAMTNFDTETGFYLDRIQCTAVLGYEVGKTYTALIKATVDSVAAITAYTWRILTPPVNVAQWLGTACATPTVNGVPEVDLTHIEGTAHASTSIRANLISILGTTLTETAGQIAAAFKQFFDVGTPTGTMKAITNVVTATNLTTNNDKTGYSISGTKTTLDALNDITAASVWVVTTRTLTSFGTLIDDIWNYSTRTITAFSTSLALSVWDILETAILTASSIGLKVKNNLDATISSRLATSGYTAPDNAGISSILTESQSHPTLGEIEASAVIAKETTITAVKTKTDTIIWGDITDIKNVNMGKWSINKTTNVLTIYKVDGVTVLKTFNLTDNSSVSERVPI